MNIYEMKDNKLVLQGAFIQDGKEIVESGNGLMVIKDGEMRRRLLIKSGDVYYDLGEPFLDFQTDALKMMCKGKWSKEAKINEQIIRCIASDTELLTVIPNFFYMNIPGFAENLQCQFKDRVYADYANCKNEEIDKFLVQTQQQMKKITDYIKQQESGKDRLKDIFEPENDIV